MSLLDGTSKMSKSDPADGSRINLLDTPAEITKKIKRCKVPPKKLTPNTVELIPTLGALFPRGGPVQDPAITRSGK